MPSLAAKITLISKSLPSHRPGPTRHYEGGVRLNNGIFQVLSSSDEAKLKVQLKTSPTIYYSKWRDGVFSVVVSTKETEFTVLCKTSDISGLQGMVRSLMGLPPGGADDKENRPAENRRPPQPKTPVATTKRRCSNKKTPSPIKTMNNLSTQQSSALTLFMTTSHNIFLTGSAGTGKTYLLKTMIQNSRKGTMVTSTTNVGAVLLEGCSLQSFAGFGIRTPDKDGIKEIFKNDRVLKRWQKTKTLIIDECSMLSAALLTSLNIAGKLAHSSNEPFGGIRLVFCGDFYQLPPVTGEFCFTAASWTEASFTTIELLAPFRQRSDFAAVLDRIRLGTYTSKDSDLINSRKIAEGEDLDDATILCTHVNQVNAINDGWCDRHETKTFTCVDTGVGGMKSVPKELRLFISARVVLTANVNKNRSLVNGTQGVVVRWEKGLPVVRFDLGFNRKLDKLVGMHRFEAKLGSKVVSSRSQIPLQLSYALSIHKSQGMTLSKVVVDLEKAFEDGMAYVALSRVKSLAGLRVKGEARMGRVSEVVRKFWEEEKEGAELTEGKEGGEGDDEQR
ncbi:hypothetical protein TrVE_jg13506 [Triparma verrucosa]|uniref:ATP-dependent DNA helicase n=1 Tax=Triparma verrucosa TaxID=1606542 RepID=A0A9W7CKE5_9STRA|nr:hypothetical protein TrVE_jg13506 [Triparma verrucosa]